MKARPSMKSNRPGGQAKPTKQNPKQADLGDDQNVGGSEESSGSARRRYNDLPDDHTGSEGASSL